tara:strand:- start:636 stop:1433 length:798 start_codon:yes stop_codon:yes gene_type:complete
MANYVNFTKKTFNPYNPRVINEGQFSWFTQDSDQQIGSERENTIDVWMYDNQGNSWYEKHYQGYGEFGGMDYYELLARMNGYTEEDLRKGQEMRNLGIDLAFKKLKTKDKGKKVLFPALVADGKYNWKRHDFTKEAESDPNQSWYQEPEYDEFYDESKKPELTWEGLKESLGLNEGRSINKISKDHAATVLDMANTAKQWKAAEGDRKTELLDKLRELNKQKADLEKELDAAVAGKDRGLQLSLEEAEDMAYLEKEVHEILNENK